MGENNNDTSYKQDITQQTIGYDSNTTQVDNKSVHGLESLHPNGSSSAKITPKFFIVYFLPPDSTVPKILSINSSIEQAKKELVWATDSFCIHNVSTSKHIFNQIDDPVPSPKRDGYVIKQKPTNINPEHYKQYEIIHRESFTFTTHHTLKGTFGISPFYAEDSTKYCYSKEGEISTIVHEYDPKNIHVISMEIPQAPTIVHHSSVQVNSQKKTKNTDKKIDYRCDPSFHIEFMSRWKKIRARILTNMGKEED